MNGFDDFDDIFNKIDEMMNKIDNTIYHSYSSDDLETMEDDDYIYITLELRKTPAIYNATIREDNKGKYLSIGLETSSYEYDIPEYADEVEQCTLVNNVLDIIIKKYDRRKE
jgi:hypothetical protein